MAAWVLSIALGPASPFADEPSWDELVLQGKQAEEAGDSKAAADAYARAYRGMPPGERTDFGADTVIKAAAAYKAYFGETADFAAMESSRDLLLAFVDDAATGTWDVPTEIGDELARVERVLAQREPGQPSGTVVPPTDGKPEGDGAPAEDAGAPGAEDPPTDPAASEERARDEDLVEPAPGPEPTPQRDKVGLALVIAGPIVALGGIPFIAQGVRLRDSAGDAEDALPALQDDERYQGASSEARESFDRAYQDYVDGERGKGGAMIGVGVTLLAVGTGAAIYGAVRLARGKRRDADRERQVSWAPWIGGGRTGLGLAGRF